MTIKIINMKKFRFLLGCCALLCATSVNASVVIDGLYYDLNSSDKTATVVYSDTYKSLTSVVIPDTVTSEGVKYAVAQLASGSYPLDMAKSSFHDCSNLTSIVILANVKSIGNSVFRGCSNLTSITIPSSVMNIGAWAFSECSSLASVTIPSNVTSIGEGAFFDCTAISSVKIPSSTTSIGDQAFSYCYTLSSISIPFGVNSIGTTTFEGCSSLTSVTLPSSLTNIGYAIFAGCINLKNIVIDDQNPNYSAIDCMLFNKDKTTLLSCPSASEDFTIPSHVTSIGYGALVECTNLKTIIIPSSVTNIGPMAFGYCPNLVAVTIPSSVTSIGDRAFIECSNLKSITIPSSVTSIGNYAFDGCRRLKSVIIPSSLLNSYKDHFNDATSVVIITPTNNSINMANTFTDCTGLTSVTIPSDVTSIGANTFSGCTNLQSVTIPSSVTSLGVNAFTNCTSLKQLTIPSSVKEIGVKAFSGCTGLTNITIPSSVNTINAYAFDGCTNLKKVYSLCHVPVTGLSIFNGIDLSKDTLCVEDADLWAYRDSATWKDFGTIKALSAEEGSLYNTLFINDTTTFNGTQVKLPILMNNLESITAFQFDLYLPSGVNVAKENGDYMIDLGERTTLKKHTVASQLQTDGAIRVVAYSNTSSDFVGNSGPVLYVTLNTADSLTDGDYPILLKNKVLSTVNAVEHRDSLSSSRLSIKTYTIGDVDNSGSITITDAVMIINKILGTEPKTFVEKAADLDKNGVVNINDAVALINRYVLKASSVKAHFVKVSAEETTNLQAVPFAINRGEEKTVDIVFNNAADDITAFQTDMNLPEGFSVVKDADGDYSALAMGRNMEKTHQMASNMLENGDLRMICYSMKNASIEGTGGAVATVRVKADNNVVAGVYYLTLHNTVLAHTNGLNAITPADVKSAINVGTTGITDKSGNGLSVKAGRGMVTLQAAGAQNVQIVSADGRQIANFSLQAGEKRTIRMAAGVYVANGKKIAVK
jgi:hypothetical protein